MLKVKLSQDSDTKLQGQEIDSQLPLYVLFNGIFCLIALEIANQGRDR